VRCIEYVEDLISIFSLVVFVRQLNSGPFYAEESIEPTTALVISGPFKCRRSESGMEACACPPDSHNTFSIIDILL